VGESTDVGSWAGVYQQVGGELYAPAVDNPSGSFADTFEMYVEGQNTSGTWYYYGKPNSEVLTYGFQGTPIYGNSQWAWNEPA
jgi:hypothetical protein